MRDMQHWPALCFERGPGELSPHLNSREAVVDFDDEDPDGYRGDAPAGRDDGNGRGEIHIPE